MDLGSPRGLSWPWAVLVAFSLSALGAVVDMRTGHSLGWIFRSAYVVGCLAAVCGVRRTNLFGPMMQPPVVLAVVAPTVVALWGDSVQGGSLSARAVSAAVPVVDNFLVLAGTTAATVAIGLARLARHRG